MTILPEVAGDDLDDLLDLIQDDVQNYEWSIDQLLKLNDRRPDVPASAELDDVGTIAGRAVRLARELQNAANDFNEYATGLMRLVNLLRQSAGFEI